MPFLRQGKKTLGQKHQLARQHRQFAGARAEQRAFDADEVADVEQLVQLEVAFGKLILLRVDLKLSLAIRKRKEACFSKRTIRENTSGNTNFDLVVLQFFGVFSAKLLRLPRPGCACIW